MTSLASYVQHHGTCTIFDRLKRTCDCGLSKALAPAVGGEALAIQNMLEPRRSEQEHRRYLAASRLADSYRKERNIWETTARAEAELGKQWMDRAFAAETALAALPPSPLRGREVNTLLARARQFVVDSGCDEDDNEVNSARDELLADMDATIGVPDGWKLVPIEPTKEMITAGDMLTYSQDRFKVSEVYRAMVSAAAPPEQPAAPAKSSSGDKETK